MSSSQSAHSKLYTHTYCKYVWQKQKKNTNTLSSRTMKRRRWQTAWNFRIRKHERRVCELLPLFWLINYFRCGCCYFKYLCICLAAAAQPNTTFSRGFPLILLLLLLDFSHSIAYKNQSHTTNSSNLKTAIARPSTKISA